MWSPPASLPRSSEAEPAGRGAAEVSPPPDPCEAPLRELLTRGEAHVTSPDGTIEYRLQQMDELVYVAYRAFSPPDLDWQWVNGNNWHWPAQLYVTPGTVTSCTCNECLAARRLAVQEPEPPPVPPVSRPELAALAILNAIFSGRRLWALQCGTDITHPAYDPGVS